VRLNYMRSDQNIGSMLVSGELDATLLYLPEKNLVDRSRIDLGQYSEIQPLFPDPTLEGTRYYRKTGIFPINHGLIIRRSLVEKHPWIAIYIYHAFQAAKEHAGKQAD